MCTPNTFKTHMHMYTVYTADANNRIDKEKEHWDSTASLFSTKGIMNTTTMLFQLCYGLPKIDAGAGRSNNKWILIFRGSKLFNCHTGYNPKKPPNANRSRPYSAASCCLRAKLPAASCSWQRNWFLRFTYQPGFRTQHALAYIAVLILFSKWL